MFGNASAFDGIQKKIQPGPDHSNQTMHTDQLAIQKILLIDDDEDDHIVFKLALTELDSSVQLFYTNCADNLLAILDQVKPHLIFLDINLPRTDGIECLQLLQNDAFGKSIPVVMYSSSELPRDLQLSFDAGASLYFRKPTDVSRLVAALKEILEMDWRQPATIRSRFLVNGRYTPYSITDVTG